MNMKIEGDTVKRYQITYWGNAVYEGHWDSAKDALAKYESHKSIIKPQIDKDPRAKEHRPSYSFRRDRIEITLADLRKDAQAEG